MAAGIAIAAASLGGCLAIRAAAFEPRVRGVVAFDVLSDFFECMMAVHPGPASSIVRALLATGADGLIDLALSRMARHDPVLEWGIAQACHVFGREGPAGAFSVAQTLHTRDVSERVRQHVLPGEGPGALPGREHAACDWHHLRLGAQDCAKLRRQLLARRRSSSEGRRGPLSRVKRTCLPRSSIGSFDPGRTSSPSPTLAQATALNSATW